MRLLGGMDDAGVVCGGVRGIEQSRDDGGEAARVLRVSQSNNLTCLLIGVI